MGLVRKDRDIKWVYGIIEILQIRDWTTIRQWKIVTMADLSNAWWIERTLMIGRNYSRKYGQVTLNYGGFLQPSNSTSSHIVGLLVYCFTSSCGFWMFSDDIQTSSHFSFRKWWTVKWRVANATISKMGPSSLTWWLFWDHPGTSDASGNMEQKHILKTS